MSNVPQKHGWLQHKVRPEVKAWIEREAKALERSQTWFINKLVEDAYARAQQPQVAQQ